MEKKYLNFTIKTPLQLECEKHLAESVVTLTEKQKLSLYKKSQKSGIDTGVLEEVYRRGYLIWKPELFEGTREQFAFDRVNSFVSGGFAADLDSDLVEAYYSKTKPTQGFEYKGKVIGAIWKNDEGLYVTKRRKNPDKKSGPAFTMKHKTREDAENHLISKSDLNEGKGLWANIHAKRERGERMRKPGEKGAPTKAAFKAAQNEEFELEESSSALAKKAKASGISLGTLKKVYARGVAAWRTGHRPGTTPQQWGMARVNSYITKGKGTYHGADKDLREARLPEVPKDKETGLPKKYTTGKKGTDKARAAHFKKGREKHWDDPSAYEPAPGDATAKTKESKHTIKARKMYGKYGENYEMPTTDPNLSSSRFEGTSQLVDNYKRMTPGQEPAPKAKLIVVIKKTVKENLEEATYKGKTVKLNKPFRTPGGPKKSAVYVDPDGDGKAQIVRFGDPNMKIKKNIPARRKSFRARHGCDTNPGPKTKARYWSCKAW